MVTIATIVDYRTDLVTLQSECFKKNMQSEYEFVILDNSPQERSHISAELRDVCSNLGLNYVYVQEQRHDTFNYAHSQALNWSWRNIFSKKNEGYTFFLDFDVFLIRKFDMDAYLNGYDIVGVQQGRNYKGRHYSYMWAGFVAINNQIKDKETLGLSCCEGCDSGGEIYKYIESHNDVKIKNTRQVLAPPKGITSMFFKGGHLEDYGTGAFDLFEDSFLHYIGATNWGEQGSVYHAHRTEYVKNIINSSLNS